MIDYIPPDIPKAVVEFVDKNFFKQPDLKGKIIKYLTTYNGKELYALAWVYYSYTNSGRIQLLVYDCHDARRATLEEERDFSLLMPKYLSGFVKQEHLCHRDQKAFNQHTTPEDYLIKVKHVTPKYIPKAVVEYIDNNYPDSKYPGATKRTIKYIASWENYEAYRVHWESPKGQNSYSTLVYDCKDVSLPNFWQSAEIGVLKSKNFHAELRPNLCNKGL